MPRRKAKKQVPIGQKIKKARTSKKLKLDQVANETGFSIDYLKEIESGKAMPPVGALLQISRALEIDSGSLLKETESTMESRIKAHTKRTENYAYTTLTPGAENKHLKAFLVSVEPHQDHKGVGYHHEGEEFVFVLRGKIEVAVGEHVNVLETGDSLHFNSGIQHNMKSISDETSEMLVVIYSP